MRNRTVLLLGIGLGFGAGLTYERSQTQPLVVTHAADSLEVSRIELDHLGEALYQMGSSLRTGQGATVYKEKGSSGGVSVNCTVSGQCTIRFPEETPEPLRAGRRVLETKVGKAQAAPSGSGPMSIKGERVTSFEDLLVRLKGLLKEGDRLREVVVIRNGKRMRLKPR